MNKYGVALVALLAFAGCGLVQSKDDQFIRRLVDQHVIPSHVANRAELIRQGKRWCAAISRPGVTKALVAQAMAQEMDGWPAVKRDRNTLLLGDAVGVYCPEAGKRLRD